jgi:hypothetical protein
MKAIVADTAGTGTLIDKDGAHHQLAADQWVETDVRDTVIGPAWVRYRADGETVEVGDGQTYQLRPPANPDVVDLRGATVAAEEIAAAMDGIGTDEERIYAALATAPQDDSRHAWFDQLHLAFRHRTGHSLETMLRDELSGDELERALLLLH